MKPNILMTPQFKQAFKLLKKKHQNNILKDIIKVIEQLVNFEITTQKSNHPLSDGINDLHIRGDVILLYRYQGAGLIIDLNLLNISDHKELQKNLKLAMKDNANIPFDLEKEKKNLKEQKFETSSQGQILKRGDLSEYKISDKELEEVKNREIKESMTNKEKLMKRFPELNLNEDIEMCDNKLNKQEVLDWISEHDLAWEDFVNYFEDIYQSSAEVPMDEIIGWISEHDELAEDFEARFNAGIFIDADDYDDFSEEEIEEHLAIDAYDQLNSPNILEINTTRPNKLKESIEGKWNIGSNKLVSTDNQEYANLVDLAKLLQERSPNGYEYRVEKTYEDFGAGMQWYTIICDEKNGWGTHQVLNTKQWLDLANTGDIEDVYQDVVSNKYFQDKSDKTTTSLFNHMNSLED